jgi:hypothetical protein
MVRGLDLFKEHFKDHTDSFVIIGGTACSLLLEGLTPPFRATKDIDIILYVEKMKPTFGKIFWDFISKGGYKNLQQSTGKKIFYRFKNPDDEKFPFMIELFSSKPDGLEPMPGSHLTPIPFDGEVSSLSAILLDEIYYPFLQSGRMIVDGLPVVNAGHLIPLKVKAYFDLSTGRNQGKVGDSKDIKKHQNDVFRLFPLLAGDQKIPLPTPIAEEMRTFLTSVSKEQLNLKLFGINILTLQEVIQNLKNIYNL